MSELTVPPMKSMLLVCETSAASTMLNRLDFTVGNWPGYSWRRSCARTVRYLVAKRSGVWTYDLQVSAPARIPAISSSVMRCT